MVDRHHLIIPVQGNSDDDEENKKRQLKKAVAAVHVSGNTTFFQKKLLNNLAFYAFPFLASTDTYKVSVAQLAHDSGFDSHNIEYLKKNLKNLLKKIIEWNLLGDKGSDEWGASVALAEVIIKDGMLTYSFAPSVRKMLTDPRIFSLINLQLMKKFSSGYAYDLYENVGRFRKIGTTGDLPVDTVRKFLGIADEKNAYTEFKYLNARILGPAIEEVNKVSDIEITGVDFKREARKVVAIRFNMIEKDAPAFLPTDDQTKVDVLRRMLDLGISEKSAYRYLENHPIDYLSGNLNVVEERVKSSPTGKIKSLSLYFKKAVDEDWRPVKSTIDLKREEEEKEKAEKADRIKASLQAQEEERQRLAAEKRKKAKLLFDAKSEAEQERIEILFSEYLKRHNPIILDAYKAHGVGSKMVLGSFSAWLADEYDQS